MISLQDVSKTFGDLKAVDRLSFTIQSGEVVGFLGPNGAGKSTTMRMITGFLPPSSGSIQIDGLDVTTHSVACKKKIGYLPESAAIYSEMEVTDFLVFMGRMHGVLESELKARLQMVVKQCQLQKVLGRQIGDLSKGYRQRVGLAQALLHNPDILILDEPTVGLDPNQIAEIRELIKEIGKTKTVMLSSHILQEVTATCQRVIIINEGKIVAQGTPDELTNNSGEQTTYHVGIRGSLDAIQRQIPVLPDYVATKVLESAGDLHKIAIHCRGSQDLCELIFQMAVKNHWSLALLVRERQSLEEVFKRLTS